MTLAGVKYFSTVTLGGMYFSTVTLATIKYFSATLDRPDHHSRIQFTKFGKKSTWHFKTKPFQCEVFNLVSSLQ